MKPASIQTAKVESEGRTDHVKVTLTNGATLCVPKNHPLATVGAVIANAR